MINEKKLIEDIWKHSNNITTEWETAGILNLINQQPKVGEWIPVSERLPEGCEEAEIELLISTYEEYPDALIEETVFALYYPGTKQFHSVYGDRLDITEIVTAWKYLPAPYDMRKKVEE